MNNTTEKRDNMLCEKCNRTMLKIDGTDKYFCYSCQLEQGEKPKKSKHNNKGMRVDDHYFPSQLEADYYGELKLRQKAGEIDGFCVQPKFILAPGASHKADFIIFYPDGTFEIIDTKGMRTKDYIFTMKIFKDKYPNLDIREVR